MKKDEFLLTSFTAHGAKTMKLLYEKMGYKHVTISYNDKKQLYENIFKHKKEKKSKKL